MELDTIEDIDYTRNLGHSEAGIAEAKADRGKRRWVNAYTTSRQFGGLEEGGWYYNEGYPIASIPAYTDEDVKQARAYLERWRGFYEVREGHPKCGRLVVGFAIWEEKHKAKPYPDKPPRYE